MFLDHVGFKLSGIRRHLGCLHHINLWRNYFPGRKVISFMLACLLHVSVHILLEFVSH